GVRGGSKLPLPPPGPAAAARRRRSGSPAWSPSETTAFVIRVPVQEELLLDRRSRAAVRAFLPLVLAAACARPSAPPPADGRGAAAVPPPAPRRAIVVSFDALSEARVRE